MMKSEPRLTKLETQYMARMKRENEHICYYCGKKIEDEDQITVDHKIPVARGGQTVEFNLVICCKDCNITKSNLTESEYKEIISKSLEQFHKMEIYRIITQDCTKRRIRYYQNKLTKQRAEMQKKIETEKYNIINLMNRLTLNPNKDREVNKKMVNIRTRLNKIQFHLGHCEMNIGLAAKIVNKIDQGMTSAEIEDYILKIIINKNRLKMFGEVEEIA